MDVLHGVEVADPYRWLEDGDDPEVRAWSSAQNERTRAVLDALPDHGRWHAAVLGLLRPGVAGGPSIAGDRLFSLDRWGDLEQAVLVVRSVDTRVDGPAPELVDPVKLSGGDTTATIDWYEPSPDGALVAFGLSTGGSERSTLRVVSVPSGELLADEIPETRACSLAWEPGGGAFVYTRYPDDDEYHRHVRRHVLGEDPAGDEVVLGPDELPEPTAWPSVELSRDGRWLLVSMSVGWSRTDLRLLDRSAGTWASVIEDVDALTSLSFDEHRGGLVGVTTLDAGRGRGVRVPLDAPGVESWTTVVAESDDGRRVLDWVAPLPSGLLARTTRWGVAELWFEGRALDVPGVGDVVGVATHDERDLAVVAWTSFDRPTSLLKLTLPSSSFEPWSSLPGVPDVAGLSVEQVDYDGGDGVRIPMFVVSGGGPGPTILTGYGGFAIAETPAWSASIAAWCLAGGTYAIAGIRGGFEEGEAWHQAGMRGAKQRVFDDFFAAADWLVSSGRCERSSLGLSGGSNGGLLMGACITQRPDLAAAVRCAVPLLDMVRFPRFLIAKLWVSEYGDPDVAEEFAWLHAYSPYHRVVDGTCYPATLLTTAEEDTRVDPCHARKFGALLQAATSCGDENPVLVRVESRAGHGVGKPVGKLADEAADVLAFLGWRLGLGA